MLTLNEIRTKFLDYFESKGHKIMSSSPVVPQNDPTLLFTNAGMVQFKNYFTGAEKPKYKRAATAQKCIRAGGKHNDLDNVGYTARHHTFFEMLGNFSFGDYFKEDAIKYAWEFLTEVLKLDKNRLYVTIYHTDEEAFEIWNKIVKVPEDRIIRISTNDNFWSMGETGPCGPCTEIFYDHGAEIKGGLPGTPEEDGDRYIEVWNVVFMQYERLTDGTMVDLPKPSIDTGSGIERLTAVLQGVHNNYEIDLFQKIIANSKSIIGDNGDEFAHRVIADHLRSCSFLVADGVLPSNEGRGYVLRRIMRRAMRHIHILSPNEAKMYRLVPTLVDLMGDTYPELKRAENLIIETMKVEEERFKKTLDKGLKLLEQELNKLGKTKVLSGEFAFMLYDTYGFPLDLTQDILREKDMAVDEEEFQVEMNKQKERAKGAWSGSGDAKTGQIYFDIKEKVGETKFIGYDECSYSTKITSLIVDGEERKSVKEGEKFEFTVEATPFYGESGGQAGDSGLVIKALKDGSPKLPFEIIEVSDTKKPVKGLFVHKGSVASGEFKVGDTINMAIDKVRRAKIQANHSAAHLLHFALRDLLGDTVTQKGSSVTEAGLRLDVSINRAITREEIAKVEQTVNEMIIRNFEVSTNLMNIEDARESGAMALFGEKYDDEVRVVSMGKKAKAGGKSAPNKPKGKDASIEEAVEKLSALSVSEEDRKNLHSIELCGGTHVVRTGDIGFFKVTSESALAAGVRRIEAVTGLEAVKLSQHKSDLVDELTDILSVTTEYMTQKIQNLIAENKRVNKELADLKKASLSSDVKFTEEKVGEILFVTHKFDDINPKDLKGVVQNLRDKKEYKDNTVIAFFGTNEGKVSVVVSVSDDPANAGKIDAPTLVRTAVEKLGGKGGGGQPTLAMGGGSDVNKINDSIKTIKEKLTD